uniref:tRNA (34-2'-O)-methyltransferase regulator WDR6 n=1 Tax=Scleropages formosus TaxID=113540 RepID=A0A8C9SQ70_SCLFO
MASPDTAVSALLVAPVTALEFLGDDCLLAGKGPVLSAYSLRAPSVKSASLSVLRNHRVHGIRPERRDRGVSAEVAAEEEPLGSSWQQRVQLVVFGGKALRLVELGGSEAFDLRTLGPVRELQDWVLDVRWVGGAAHLLGVALAHNAVLLLEAWEGHVLLRSSCEDGCLLYSALLVGPCWQSLTVVGGTVFNQLVIWRPTVTTGSGRTAPVERRLKGHSGVIFGLAYLPERGWLASASDDRSVRVWGVGPLGGAAGCGDPSPTCLQVLYGHQARVFSVTLLPVGVLSAGEDGVCLLWDCGSGKVSRALNGHRVGGVRALAVSSGWGGRSPQVATGGADGGIRLWSLGETDGGQVEAELVQDLEFQGGGSPKVVRMVWGGVKRHWGVVASTDQGEVYLWEEGSGWQLLWRGGREGAASSRGALCAVGSLSGDVWLFPLSQPARGTLLRAGLGKVHSVLWEGDREQRAGHLLVSGPEGLVRRWLVKPELGEGAVSLDCVPLRSFLLPPCAKRWLTAAILVPQPQGALWVCGDRRGSLLLYRDSDEGGEAVGDALRPLSVLFGVHGKQGVTSVCEHRGLLYSTGRDGCLRVSRVGDGGGGQLEVLRVQRACGGMDWLERVVIREPEGEGDACFLLMGFHSVHFEVWDLLRRERLLSVPCGGGHRSWSYCPPGGGSAEDGSAVVFVKQGAVLASRTPADTSHPSGASLELEGGLHGRGITCVCHLGAVRAAGDRWEVLATGGEDTRVSVLAVRPQNGAVKVLAVIADHISSVRALAALRRQDGGGGATSLSALLFSAGGRAQLQCCRLLIGGKEQVGSLSCQVIQVARHRLDEHWERRRNRHKLVKMDPETRYMSLSVVSHTAEQVFLAAACSDGVLFSVSESGGKFHLLWDCSYHQRCVLSVASCCLEDPEGNELFVISAATDGIIAFWDMTGVTDVEDGQTAPPSYAGKFIPAHQSGVNTLALWEGPWEGQEAEPAGHSWMTIASGGDDGQLSVIRIQVQLRPREMGGSGVSLKLWSRSALPSAHAAPLTALCFLSPALLVSTSPDQRVCLWNLCASSLGHGGVLFSHVADAAGLAVWKGTEAESGPKGSAWVAVCGQGLQVLRLKEERDAGKRTE